MSEIEISVIIPCFNEIETLGDILRKTATVLPEIRKELVIVDDCSSDGSRELIAQIDAMTSNEWQEFLAFASPSCAVLPSVNAVFHRQNGGKGTAIRSGLAAAEGAVVVIQDADLEYDPDDWVEMYDLIQTGRADVVYGSRFYGRPHRSLYYHHYLANRFISLLFNMLYNQILTDIETCYKMFRREVVNGVPLQARDFGIEVELSAAIVLARKWRIYEMGIRYFGRTYEEGKKINWRDGVKALWYLVRFRFKDFTPKDLPSPPPSASGPLDRAGRRSYDQRATAIDRENVQRPAEPVD